jgi:hypothetical protein
MAEFEWDSRKEAENIRERGIDFIVGSLIWDSPVYERVDARQDYGEIRLVGFGDVEGDVLAVVYTWRGIKRRIISVRKADRRERRLYREEIQKARGSESD